MSADDQPHCVPPTPAESLGELGRGVLLDPSLSCESLLAELDDIMDRRDLNSGDERAVAVVRDLAFWARRTAVVLRMLQAQASRADQFLTREGFRRCDAPACNCGSWHRTDDSWEYMARRLTLELDSVGVATVGAYGEVLSLFGRIQRMTDAELAVLRDGVR